MVADPARDYTDMYNNFVSIIQTMFLAKPLDIFPLKVDAQKV